MFPLRGILSPLGVGRGGGDADLFWKYAAPSLKNQALLQISCFGDSITAGSYNEPKASRVWTPEAAATIIGLNASRTVTTGSELFLSRPHVFSSGASEAGGVFTLTASAGDTNPRFAIKTGAAALIAISAGELYLMRAQINTSSSVGKHLALREIMYNAAEASLGSDIDFGGDDDDTGGYVQVAGVISIDYLKSLQATFVKLNVGGEIVGAETSGTGLIQGVELYKLSSGVSIVNQGISGDDTIEGLARIATVTAWTPDAVVIAFGTNDIREHNNLNTFTNNLTTMCSIIAAASGYPILATMPPLGTGQPHYTDVPTWNAAIYSLSQSLNVGYWDRWGALGGSLSYIEDERHPTRAGYLLLAQDLANKITQ